MPGVGSGLRGEPGFPPFLSSLFSTCRSSEPAGPTSVGNPLLGNLSSRPASAKQGKEIFLGGMKCKKLLNDALARGGWEPPLKC